MKRKTSRRKDDLENLTWLNDVREVTYPLDSNHPIFIREVHLLSGDPCSQPTVPFPERHPYCEVNIKLAGRTTQFIGGEKIDRGVDIMLLGPDTPHYAFRHSYPHRTLTIFFLPLILFEMGPDGGGRDILSRFTAPQPIGRRILTPPPAQMKQVASNTRLMSGEWKVRSLGFELKLLSLLVDTLVDLLRWERATGKRIDGHTPTADWARVEKVLRYIHEHFTEPIYIEEIAARVGVPTNRLRAIFRHAMGTTCSHYIQSVRIARAKALLCLPSAQVARVAYEVGFESISHFNICFRKQTGLSPTDYIKRQISRPS